jgi:predicted acetyltransferase
MAQGELVSLCLEHKDALNTFLREFEISEDELHGYFIDRSTNIEKVIATLEAWNRGEELPDGWVPNTTWFWESDGTIQGVINVRHHLTAWLEENGGHIGYSVSPSQRQQGVATAMLRSALIKCTEFEIMKAMLICDSDNVGSRRAIEANNGILQREENGQRWYLIKL